MDEKFEIKKVVLKRTWCVRRQIGVRRLRRMCVRTCIKGWHTIENWCIKVKENFQEMQRARRRKNVQRNALGNNKVLLSPMILSPLTDNRIDQYRYNLVNELRNAIDSNNCNNIAITGVYGSGKSSIIQTYLAEMSARFRASKVLTLSLSNFLDQEPSENEGNTYENTIESKIFQHILFKANEDRTAQTHYKKIANISWRRAFDLTLLGLFVVLCFFIVFFPHLLLSFKYIGDAYKWIHSLGVYKWIHGVVYLGSIIFMLYALSKCFIYIIRRAKKIQIKGVEVENLKVSFEENAKTPFNELLDEILYFFRAGAYKIVIFEDLDRIYNPDRLFLKLREINLLLNESDYYKRRGESIKFIYAIRDDLFQSEIRTKCFDYIIPVVPIVDKYNAGDYLIKHYGKTIMQTIDARNLSVIGMYIQGKRELSNIVNEYGMSYKAFIVDATSTTKLLALLVYKNAYPQDYAKAYQKEGCLYAIFNAENKERFYSPVIAELVEKENEKTKNIQNSLNIIHAFRSEIVKILQNDDVVRLGYRGVEYPVDDLVQNELLYGAFMDNKIESYYDAANTKYSYNKDYTQIATEAHPEIMDIDDFVNRHEEEYQELVQQKSELHQEIERLKNQGISALLKEQDSKKALEIIKDICAESYKDTKLSEVQQKQHAELMLVFLREEYIAEDYVTYMSLTYEGSLSENDYVYINSVLQDTILEKQPTINNVGAVIQRLRSDDFRKNSILNNIMLDYLLQTKDEVRLKDVINVARKNFEFTKNYVGISRCRTSFLQSLFNRWEGAVAAFMDNENSELRNAMFLLYVECLPSDVELNDSEIEFMENMYVFISTNIPSRSVGKFRRYLTRYKLKFKQLQEPTERTQAIFAYVIENGYFTVTNENLRVIYGKEFENAAFTQIYSGNSKVLKYVHPDFDELIPNIPETSIHEAPETIVKLINDKEVDFEVLIDYINKQEAQIDLKEVDEKYVEVLVLKTNIVRPTWENVDNAYIHLKAANDHYLAEYVKRNIEELVPNVCVTENADDMAKMLLLETNEFSNEEYRRIADCFKKQMGQAELEGMVVPDEHMRMLIEKGKLLFDKDTYECIETNYSTPILSAYVIVNYKAFIEDEDIVIKDSNALGKDILESALSLDDKKKYMEQCPFDKDGRYAKEYAKLYCFYSEKIGDFRETDMNALIDAMNMYQEDGSWYVKISIVNQINRTLKYNQDIETRLLNTFGEPYNLLSQYGHHTPKFDDNPENSELLDYLKDNHPFVSDVKPSIWNQLKVTFKHKGAEY